MNKSLRAKIYSTIVEYTSIPLLITIYLLFISGYGLTKIELVNNMTFGLINYGESLFLHISLLKYIAGLLTVFHSTSGLGLLIIKKIKNNMLKLILEIINITIIGIGLTMQLTILEFS